MKKQLLLITTAALSTVAVAEGPIDGSIYGKVNVSVVNADESNSDQWNLNSNASRVGFKGQTEIADGLYAVYKAEFEMAVDDGDVKGQTFTQRNIMGGIQGSFGTLWAGHHDTPTKLAQNKIDLFNDLEGDIKNTFEGENRVSNIIAYTSPTFNGFTATVAMVPGEGSDFDGDGKADDSLADGISYSLSYELDNLYLAIAGDQDVDFQDLLRVVAQYSMDNLTLGLMYQQNENSYDANLKDESGYFVSAAYKIDKITLKAQYGTLENDANGKDEETWSVGADYSLAKNTTLFSFYSNNTDEAGNNASDEDDDYFGVGMEHKF